MSKKKSKEDELTVKVDVQGLDEFLESFHQMDVAVNELRNSLQHLSGLCHYLRKSFNITNNYRLSYSNEPDEKDYG